MNLNAPLKFEIKYPLCHMSKANCNDANVSRTY